MTIGPRKALAGAGTVLAVARKILLGAGKVLVESVSLVRTGKV